MNANAEGQAAGVRTRAELEAAVRDAVMAGREHLDDDAPCPVCEPRITSVLAAAHAYLAAHQPKPAPELRADVEAWIRVWREVGECSEDIDGISREARETYVDCADQLAEDLAKYPPQAQPAPELAQAMRETRLLLGWLAEAAARWRKRAETARQAGDKATKAVRGAQLWAEADTYTVAADEAEKIIARTGPRPPAEATGPSSRSELRRHAAQAGREPPQFTEGS